MDYKTELSFVKNKPGNYLVISPLSSTEEVILQKKSGKLEDFVSSFRENLILIGFYNVTKK